MSTIPIEIRFRFQEELALKNSLYPIAETVLAYALKHSGAEHGVFVYAPPGASQFEKVTSMGVPVNAESSEVHLDRNGKHPLAEALRNQKVIKVLSSDEKCSAMAFPLIDAGMAIAGFLISFVPDKALEKETEDFLMWLAQQAETALFNKDGEGV